MAIEYYLLSANKYNNVLAINKLADEYARGENVDYDIMVAMNYHDKASKLGYYPSMVKLAFCYIKLQDYSRVHKLILDICKVEKNIMGNYILGICNYWGLGVRRNIYKAFDLFVESNKYKETEINQVDGFDYDPRFIIDNYHEYGTNFYNGLLRLNGINEDILYTKEKREYYRKAFNHFENELVQNKYFNINLTKYVHNSYLTHERLIEICKEYKDVSLIACINYIILSNYDVDNKTKEKIDDYYIQYIYGNLAKNR